MYPDKLSWDHCHSLLGTPSSSSFSYVDTAFQLPELLHQQGAHPDGNGISSFLWRPWHTYLGRRMGSYLWPLKPFPLLCLVPAFPLGVSPIAHSQWKSFTLHWGFSSNVISLNPCDRWDTPLHFLLLQMPLISSPQVEIQEDKAGASFFIFPEVNSVLGT